MLSLQFLLSHDLFVNSFSESEQLQPAGALYEWPRAQPVISEKHDLAFEVINREISGKIKLQFVLGTPWSIDMSQDTLFWYFRFDILLTRVWDTEAVHIEKEGQIVDTVIICICE